MKKKREHARCIYVLVFMNRADQQKTAGCDWAPSEHVEMCGHESWSLGSVCPSLSSWKTCNNVILNEKFKAAQFYLPWIDFPAGDGNVKETGGVSGRGEWKVGGSPKPPSEDPVCSEVEEGKRQAY